MGEVLKTRVLFSVIFADFLTFEYFRGWLESCNLSIEKNFCFMHAYQVADVAEGTDRWPVVKLMLLSSVFLALTSVHLVVTESSFKNVICWAT